MKLTGVCSYCPQDSEMLYCGRLSLVADLLQALFKDAYTLQKALLELLDKMSLSTVASEDEVSLIVSCKCLRVVVFFSTEDFIVQPSHCFTSLLNFNFF